MSIKKAEVKLLAHTPEPLAVIYGAFRQCYSAGFVGEQWEGVIGGDKVKQGDFVREVLNSGHTSPVEHVSFTFGLSGVSRALTHQLVRHRIASFSQQSQRYVDGSHFDFVMPPAVAGNAQAKERFLACMEEVGQAYVDIKAILAEDGRKGSTGNEDARFVLPQAAASNIVVTMNCRSLLNFFEDRCCTRAQWEIRSVAEQMLSICREVLPEVFNLAGAKCERLGYCPEGKFCCGRYPLPKTS